MVQLVLVKLRHDNKTIRTYVALIDRSYYALVIDGEKFNKKRYSLDDKFCLLMEDYIDEQFIFSRVISRVVYDDDNRDIFKSSKISQKISISEEVFEKMTIDEVISLEMIDRGDIIDDSYWKFGESITLKAVQGKYHLLAEYKDEEGNDASSKIHYHYGGKIEMEDAGRNIVVELDGACIKNMIVDGDIKEEVEVLTSTIISNRRFLI